MSELTLPPVAKSFFTFCKKCNADRYHKVITHITSTSAKIECEVCHSKKSYSLPKAGTARKAPVKKSVKKVGRRTSHADEYQQLMTKSDGETGLPFSIRTKYTINQKINHPKFGAGFVKSVLLDRMDVMFADELKTLIHNKS